MMRLPFARIAPSSLRLRVVATSLLGLSFLPACHPRESVDGAPDLSPRAAVSRVVQLRREADDCLARFEQRGAEALEELECFVEKQYQTTQLQSPAECPLCYYNYGYGLRMLGNYHYLRARAIQHSIANAAAADAAGAATKLAEAREQYRAYFERSIQIFRVYLATPGRLELRTFEWISEMEFALERYDSAVEGLETFLAAKRGDLSAERVRALESRLRKYRAYAETAAARAESESDDSEP